MLTNIIKDLQELKATRQEEEVMLLPSASRIAKALEEYEVNEKLSMKILQAYEEDSDEVDYDGKQSFNSYNWNGSIDHHMQGHVITYKGKRYLLLSFHRFGDVRCNYTDKAVFPYGSDEEVTDIREVIYGESVMFNITLPGDKLLYVDIKASYEGVEVSSEDNNYITVFPDGFTFQEVVKAIIEAINEEGGEALNLEEVLTLNKAIQYQMEKEYKQNEKDY